eukprot:gnl/TRDRNA2_/TRDRNA2_183075_c0_seq1.p1 gnl/TRDRNA2_/TRDRNA2_183075_c0~~gnl/TRDRNA2_/TRDRNA2_183075_c0_seq1.p1  ORF type:complete len:426 (-),score=82.44 gnl/TRDRNA2_/TRDRNA2_183075_c0_seq1:50-1327(-)
MAAAASDPQREDEAQNEGLAQDASLWTQFTQQRLKAWQPVLAPHWVISFYICFGVLFVALGIVLLFASWSVEEYAVDYTNVETDENGVGQLDITIESDMQAPIWVHYQLDGFHQNHRRYVNSRDDSQMKEGKIKPNVDRKFYETCHPWVVTDDRVNYPCGLVARSIFNDTYIIRAKGPSEEDDWQRVFVDSSAKTIAWSVDVARKFQNLDPEALLDDGMQNQVALDMWLNRRFPPVECRQEVITDEKPYVPVEVATREELLPADSSVGRSTDRLVKIADCTGHKSASPKCSFMRLGKPFTCEGDYREVIQPDWGLESGHFIVWMRIAGLPNFRKLWGKVDQDLKAGTRLRVNFVDNFPVKEFHGKKAFVISTSSVLGGRNDFLGYGYIFMGSCCLIFGMVFLIRHLKKPRPLGDVSLLAERNNRS